MSAQVIVQAKGRKLNLLGDEVLQTLQGGCDVVIAFGSSTSEDRIAKAIHAVVGSYEVELEIRHAELREYLTHALVGAAIGSGVAAAALALGVLKVGAAAISAPVALAALGIGALVGAAAGAAIVPISRVVVYKYRGETRVKFVSTQSA